MMISTTTNSILFSNINGIGGSSSRSSIVGLNIILHDVNAESYEDEDEGAVKKKRCVASVCIGLEFNSSF